MPLNFQQVRQHLDQFDFRSLFIQELGWSNPSGKTSIRAEVQGEIYEAKIVAQLGNVPVLEVQSPDGGIPDADRKRAIHRELAKHHFENLLIFVDRDRARSDWYWVRREAGKETPRSHEYLLGQSADQFFAKVSPLLFEISDFDENGDVEVVKVAGRLKLGLDVEKVTKRFYSDFQQQHIQFLELITGIDDERQLRWYASVLLNRLMFIWFLQRKGFIDRGELDYLDLKLAESKKRGNDQFFREFLRLLFFEGFAKPPEERSAEATALLGEVRYLNGGLFLPHSIEQTHPGIDVPDKAFENLFALFRRYDWNLNDTPGGDENELNPDVLGYIFEKYINQKAFGAYYTRTEITSYLCERTIERLVLDAVNTSKDEHERALPGKNYDFKSLGDLLLNLDAALCRKLFKIVLPRLSILDPACGSGAFLVAAMKTLIQIYGGVIGRIPFVGDNDLRREIAEIQKSHDIHYYLKKSIITENLYGVDIMEEAVEIARLRLFLALVASARSIDDLEPLPNIDFNLLPGNSLIGLMRVDEKKFETGDLFRKSYRQVVDEKNRQVATYRHTAGYHDDLRAQRDKIDALRADAAKSLDKILLEEFGALGIKYEEATWDHTKQREGKGKKRALTMQDIRDLQPFHWGYEFDEIVNKRGGFDAILTNPPWEVFKPNAREFFELYSDLVTRRKMTLDVFERERAGLLRETDVLAHWLEYLGRFGHQNAFFRASPDYAAQTSIVNGKRAVSDVNLYKLFLERCTRLLRDGGECGIVVPGGIYSDLGTKGLREMLFASTEITGLFAFENRKEVFEGVHRSFKFAVLTYRKSGRTELIPSAFMRHHVEELSRFPNEGALQVAVDLVKRLSPDSLSLSEFRSAKDVQIAEKLIRHPLLGQELPGKWTAQLYRELHMTDNARLFHKSRHANMLPLYEGKTIWQFDAFYSEPRYFLDEEDTRLALGKPAKTEQLEYQRSRLAFRDIAANTNERTMIATVLPPGVFTGNTLVMCSSLTPPQLLYLSAVMDSFAFDWLIRMKVSSHCNMFYVYQMPVERLDEGDGAFDQLVTRAARLICTRPEFDDLAREAGIDTEDAAHDPAERARIRAEIDAIVAHLYGLSAEELEHMLGAFPLVDPATKAQVLDTFRNWKPPSDDPLLKLIAAGESLRVEFKSTARWNINMKSADKVIEHEVLKTVAAFLNSEGGTLLIGVTDDGAIHGLGDDYRLLGKKPNADGFENWLTTRLLETMGRDLARRLVTSFVTIEGKQICRVDVRRSWRPVYLQDPLNVQQVYVRAGNSTRPLSMSEALQYCREHFPGGPPPADDAPAEAPPPSGMEPVSASGVQSGSASGLARQKDLIQPGTVETKATPNLDTHGLFKKKKAAGPEEAEPRRSLTDEYEVDDVVAIIRDVVSGSEPMEREEVIRQIGRQMGAERVGPRIRDLIESGLNAASRRSVTYTDHRGLRAFCRTIDDYKRDDLKNVLRSVVGRTWTDEDEAIRLGARYLGFRRTGSRIEQAFRSAIRGGLRQGTLERNGNLIRAT